MCGRFAFYSPTEAVVRLFRVEAADDLPPSYNIAPTREAPVIRRGGDGVRRLQTLRWGLVPFWAKDPSIGNRMINARSETVTSKPAFRQAVRSRRCLVVADGFYEWQKTAQGKTPWYIQLAGGGPFAMAGLWERWRQEGVEPLETCTILTTSPNRMMSSIHDRMPVVLTDEGVDAWLDPSTPLEHLGVLFTPVEDSLLHATRVSRKVNSPANDGPELIQETET